MDEFDRQLPELIPAQARRALIPAAREDIVTAFEASVLQPLLAENTDPELALARVRAEFGAAASETRRARRNDLKHWLQFCDQHCLAFDTVAHRPPTDPMRLPLPAHPQMVAWYVDYYSPMTEQQLESLDEGNTGGIADPPNTIKPKFPKSPNKLAVSTMKRRISSLASLHTLFGLPDPTKDALVRATMTACFRKRAGRRQAHPIRWADIQKFAAQFDAKAGNTPEIAALKTKAHWLRALALVKFAHSTAMRREELVRMRVDSVRRNQDGSAVAELAYSKTDQESEGMHRFLSADAMSSLDAWLQSSGIREGDIFCRFRSRGGVLKSTNNRKNKGDLYHPYGEAMSESEVNKIFKAIMRVNGEPEHVVHRVSGHSCRVGATLDLTKDGAATHRIQHVGGWKSPEMPARYSAQEQANESAMADFAARNNKRQSQEASGNEPSLSADDAHRHWYDFAQIAGSALRRQRSVDGDRFGTDGYRQEQAMLCAALGHACALFEAMNPQNKWNKPHNYVLSELRNACLHNNGDIRKNRNQSAHHDCLDYIRRTLWSEFDPKGSQVQKQFFDIKNGQVALYRSLLFFIQVLFDSYMGASGKTENVVR